MKRWKLTYTRGDETKYIGHLDLMRTWVRALRRACIPLAYSEGFVPHPRISFAAPLAVGVTTDGDLIEVLTGDDLSADTFLADVGPQLPTGLGLLSVGEMSLAEPSLGSHVSSIDYRIEVESGLARDELERRIATLLAAERWPFKREREGKVRHFDLRPLVDSIEIVGWDAAKVLTMRLRVIPEGTGRPEDVLAAIQDVETSSVHRLRLNM